MTGFDVGALIIRIGFGGYVYYIRATIIRTPKTGLAIISASTLSVSGLFRVQFCL